MLKTIELQLELKRHTLEEIAEICNIHRTTLHKWRRNPDYQDLYMKRSWEVLREFTPEANKALERAIKKGDVNALKLFYQLTENIREEVNVTFAWGSDDKR